MTDYTKTAKPLQGSRGISKQMRDEFALIETAVNSKSDTAGDTYTGAHDYTGGTIAVPTQSPGDNTTNAASTAFVTAAGLSSALPGQSGNAGKLINTDGATASWGTEINASIMRFADGTDSTKQLAFDLSGYTTATTRIVTFPNADVTVVDLSSTQTLTNKTLTTPVLTVDDDELTIQDNADNTKKLVFQLSGISTGTTRTLTIPNANTTIVGTAVTQTLTNKTITIDDDNFTLQDNLTTSKKAQFQLSGISASTTRTISIPDRDVTIGGEMARSSQTGAYTALATDIGDLIDWSGSSDNTLSFTAVATLADGWYCYVRNSGTADLTLDPNSTETIDGLTTFKMYPGEARLVQCDGSALRSIVLSPFRKVFTSSGTFTKPPGYQIIGGLLISAGGGGSRHSTTEAGGGGGGGTMLLHIPASDISTTESVTIGAGGTGRTGSDGVGTAGGDSSLGSLVTVLGGEGGDNTTVSGGGGGGMFVAENNANADGFAGAGATSSTGRKGVYGGGGGGDTGVGGDSTYGAGGGGGSNDQAGGTSAFAGNGGAGSTSTTATAGTAPGGGGGGGGSNQNGGDGADGQCTLWGLI